MHIARGLTVGTLALTASRGVASAQWIPEGRLYAVHSTALGACPLDWHIVVGPNNTLYAAVAP